MKLKSGAGLGLRVGKGFPDWILGQLLLLSDTTASCSSYSKCAFPTSLPSMAKRLFIEPLLQLFF